MLVPKMEQNNSIIDLKYYQVPKVEHFRKDVSKMVQKIKSDNRIKLGENISYKLLGIGIRKRRRQLRMSQAELAELTDLSIPYISFVETGKKVPSLSCLASIANALDTTIDNLLTGTLSPSSHSNPLQDKLFAGCSPEEQEILVKLLSKVLDNASELLREYAHEVSP